MLTLGRLARAAGLASRSPWTTVRLREALLVGPECAAIVAALALIWFGVWNTLSDQLSNAAAAAIRDTGNLARAFEENTERIFAGADLTLLSLRASYERDKEIFNLGEWARAQNPADRLTAQIAVIDRSGMSVASTASSQRVSIADRPHFLAQRDSDADKIYISRPVLGRSSNRWTIQVTRKIIDQKGEFDGIVVLSVDCYDLSQFYQTLDLQGGFISLLGTDGILRARGPMTANAIGTDLSMDRSFAAALFSQQGTVRKSMSGDADDVTVSFRRLTAYPLIVMVGFADSRVYGHFWATRMRMLGWASAATLVVIGLGAIWIFQRARSLASRRALALTLESMDQGIVMITADQRIAVLNPRAVELLRLPDRAPPGAPRAKALSRNWEAEVALAVAAFAPWSGAEQTVTYADGVVIDGFRRLLPDGGLLQTVTDVTDRRLAENRVWHMAHHDHLTGLGNRALLMMEIENRLVRWATRELPFFIFCVDLNGFKKINDSLGHDVGDELLVVVGKRLREAVGSAGFVARSGGDEFIVLWDGPEHAESAEQFGQRILEMLRAPGQSDGAQFSVGAGIGIAKCPIDGTDRFALMKKADLALYCAKAGYAQQVRRFDPAMAAQLDERAALERDLRAAIAADALDVAFQPQFKTVSMEVVAFEALARWAHPVHGSLPPETFIPLAEETGLIIPLGQQVLERACIAALSWPSSIRVAVNVSPAQFRDKGLPTLVAGVLARTGLAPIRLELEVTEGVVIADEHQALQTLAALQTLGIRVALDDFGTGYSSLSYLRRFPFDRIKLDRSFVQAQVAEPKARAILECVLTLTRRLQLDVVAEGVESEEQLSLLRDQRCPEIQGWLVGEPMARGMVADFLAAGSAYAMKPQTTNLIAVSFGQSEIRKSAHDV